MLQKEKTDPFLSESMLQETCDKKEEDKEEKKNAKYNNLEKKCQEMLAPPSFSERERESAKRGSDKEITTGG